MKAGSIGAWNFVRRPGTSTGNHRTIAYSRIGLPLRSRPTAEAYVSGKKMRKKIQTTFLLVLLSVFGCAHNPKAPPLVLEPNKYSYTFIVPMGWDFSFDQANVFNVRLVFFPRGGDIHKSNSIIYVNEVQGNFTSAIERVLSAAKENSPNLNMDIAPPIKAISENTLAQVRILTGAKDPRQAKEALAFIDHGEIIVLVVLTTKDVVNWQNDYKAFEEVVAGHRYFDCSSPNLTVPCR